MIEVAKKNPPGSFHKCPYVGVFEANNITFSRQLVALYPNGEFKVIFIIADGRKDLIQFEEVILMS
jgi:hypothetical protein